MWKFDAVVVSDLHLGARNSRSFDFLQFLESIDTPRLILAGDLFDDPQFRGLRPCDVQVVNTLRQLSASISVQWLCGNHDPPPRWFSGLLGIEAQDELLLDVGDKRYLVYHGHGWDRALEWPGVVISAAEVVYYGCQRIDPSHRLARYLKHKSKWFCRAVAALRHQAIAAARRRNLSGVILGHTHVAADDWIGGVHYVNCGCWTERPAGFVGVRRGQVRTYYWDALVHPRERLWEEEEESDQQSLALPP